MPIQTTVPVPECDGVSCVLAGWHSGGQSSGLLSFPGSQEGQEENHGGGAAGRRRVQTVSQTRLCYWTV